MSLSEGILNYFGFEIVYLPHFLTQSSDNESTLYLSEM
jgi:hypothetical protein